MAFRACRGAFFCVWRGNPIKVDAIKFWQKIRAQKILFGRVLIKVQSPLAKCTVRKPNLQIPFCVGAFV